MPARADRRLPFSLDFDLFGETLSVGRRGGLRVPTVALARIANGDQCCRHVRWSWLVRMNEYLGFRQSDSYPVRMPGLPRWGESGSPDRVVEVGVSVSKAIPILQVKTGRTGSSSCRVVGLVPEFRPKGNPGCSPSWPPRRSSEVIDHVPEIPIALCHGRT